MNAFRAANLPRTHPRRSAWLSRMPAARPARASRKPAGKQSKPQHYQNHHRGNHPEQQLCVMSTLPMESPRDSTPPSGTTESIPDSTGPRSVPSLPPEKQLPPSPSLPLVRHGGAVVRSSRVAVTDWDPARIHMLASRRCRRPVTSGRLSRSAGAARRLRYRGDGSVPGRRRP